MKRRSLLGAEYERRIAEEHERRRRIEQQGIQQMRQIQQAQQAAQQAAQQGQQQRQPPAVIIPEPQIAPQVVEQKQNDDEIREALDDNKSDISNNSDEVYTPNTIQYSYGLSYIVGLYQQIPRNHAFSLIQNVFNITVEEDGLRLRCIRNINLSDIHILNSFYYVPLPASLNEMDERTFRLFNVNKSFHLDIIRKKHLPVVNNVFIEDDGAILGVRAIEEKTLPEYLYLRMRYLGPSVIPEGYTIFIIIDNLAPKKLAKALEKRSDEPPKKKEKKDE